MALSKVMRNLPGHVSLMMLSILSMTALWNAKTLKIALDSRSKNPLRSVLYSQATTLWNAEQLGCAVYQVTTKVVLQDFTFQIDVLMDQSYIEAWKIHFLTVLTIVTRTKAALDSAFTTTITDAEFTQVKTIDPVAVTGTAVS
jgi:hypothetical protein